MAAAVVEFNSLPYAVWSASQDDDFFLVCGRGLVFFFVGRIQIRCVALKLRGAGIHALIYRFDLVLPAQMANLLSRAFSTIEAPDAGQALIGKAHTLRIAQNITGDRFEWVFLELHPH